MSYDSALIKESYLGFIICFYTRLAINIVHSRGHILGGAYSRGRLSNRALPKFFKLQYFYVISKYNLTRSLSAHIKSKEIQFIFLILP